MITTVGKYNIQAYVKKMDTIYCNSNSKSNSNRKCACMP